MNREHPFTRSIFTGPEVTVEGAPWLGGGSKTIGLDAMVAHILCEGHNAKLGERADVTGKALRTAIAESVRDKETQVGSDQRWVQKRSGLVVPRPEVTIPGRAYGEWLCKTHCDVMAVAGKVPDHNYVEYAFGLAPGTRPWIYYPHVPGENVGFTDNPHVSYVAFEEAGEPFGVQVCGLWAIVGLQALLGGMWIDRVAEIQFKTLTLRFDWADDPPLARSA